jgi:hypothetical protein
MFTLTEDRVRASWAWAGLVCVTLGAWSLAPGLLLGLRAGSLLGAVALLAGVGLFGVQLARLYGVRRRRTFDVHIPFVSSAIVFGMSAVGLVLLGLLMERPADDPVWVAAGWLAIAGWAQTPIQGFLFKIGTFLTWLHRYAPVAGRQPVPRLEDLYHRTTAVIGWAAWTAGVATAAAATLVQSTWLAQVGAIGLSVGAGLFIANAIRVGAHWRTPRHDHSDLAEASHAVHQA